MNRKRKAIDRITFRAASVDLLRQMINPDLAAVAWAQGLIAAETWLSAGPPDANVLGINGVLCTHGIYITIQRYRRKNLPSRTPPKTIYYNATRRPKSVV